MAGKSKKVNTAIFGKYMSKTSYTTFTKMKVENQMKLLSSSFINFIRYGIGIMPADEQQAKFVLAIDEALAGKKPRRIAVRSGHGCFAKGTPVMRYNGRFVNVEDVKVGDTLMGDDNTPRKVTQLFRGEDNMYKFTLTSGEEYIVNEHHILTLIATQSHGTQKKGMIVDVMVKDWLKWSARKKRTHAFFKRPIDFPHKEVPLDPYLLGIWLGDGGSRGSYIWLGDKKHKLIDFIKKTGATFVGRHNNCDQYKLHIHSSLKSLGVVNNKHIPDIYLYNSKKVREQVLAGLLDTDGSQVGNNYEYSSVREVLADNVVFLARSLGMHASKRAKYVKGKPYYRVFIGSKGVKLPLLRLKPPKEGMRTTVHSGIKSVEFLGKGDYYGFQVDKNGRFLGADFNVLHNSGKSAMLSWLILYIGMTTKDAKIIATAPVAAQLTEQLIPEIKKWKANMFPLIRDLVEVHVQFIKFANGNSGIFRTARKENSEAMAGVHASFVLVVIDEASGVPKQIFDTLEGALSTSYLSVFTGNPTRTSGKFYNIFHTKDPTYQMLHFDSEKSALVNPKWIEDMRTTYGEDSDVYRVRVKGGFPRADTKGLFAASVVDEAMERVNKDSGEVIMSVDPARYGDDSTVIARRTQTKVKILDVLRGKDLMESANVVYGYYKRINAVAIVIDTIGLGAGLYDRLKQLGANVIDGNSAKSAFNNQVYINKRAEMYDKLAEWLTYADIPKDEKLAEELKAIIYKFNSAGRMQIISKEELKAELGRSPDRADALALLFYSDDLTVTHSDNPEDYVSLPF